MEVIVDETIDPRELKTFEKVYNEQISRGPPSEKAQFDYSYALVKSKYATDINKGIKLLEELFNRSVDESAKRDYLFYVSVGYCRLKQYDDAKKYAKAILKVQPRNHQAKQLIEYIDKKLQKEGLLGMAIVGGAALALGSMIGVGIALAKGSK